MYEDDCLQNYPIKAIYNLGRTCLMFAPFLDNQIHLVKKYRTEF